VLPLHPGDTLTKQQHHLLAVLAFQEGLSSCYLVNLLQAATAETAPVKLLTYGDTTAGSQPWSCNPLQGTYEASQQTHVGTAVVKRMSNGCSSCY
jgi:hypothetical protein